jgi:hypothetical protein
MEVHHHSHTADPDKHRGRKKWTHYFWEFLMLFLAVFCGFLAEYQLEHKIEKDRERQYIKSFADDLAADTSAISERIRFCELTISCADSLILLLRHPETNRMAADIYYFFRFIHRSNPFTVNDRTIVQLRNAGGMRLVSNKKVSDSMLSYYKAVDLLYFLDEEQIDIKRSLRPHFGELLYSEDYARVIDESNRVVRTTEILKLKPADLNALNTIKIILENIKGLNQGIKRRLVQLKDRAAIIRQFIYNEYKMK